MEAGVPAPRTARKTRVGIHGEPQETLTGFVGQLALKIRLSCRPSLWRILGGAMGILSEYAPFLVNMAAGAPRNLSVEGEYDAPRSPFIILKG